MSNFGLGSSLRAKTFLERNRGEKGGEVRAKRNIKFLVAIFPISCF